MAYNQRAGTADPQTVGATSPDNSASGIELEARAVEREAGALVREAGGHPLAGASVPTFQDLLAAARGLRDTCELLLDETLADDQRQFLANNVLPAVSNLVSSIRDFNQRSAGAQVERGAAPDTAASGEKT